MTKKHRRSTQIKTSPAPGPLPVKSKFLSSLLRPALIVLIFGLVYLAFDRSLAAMLKPLLLNTPLPSNGNKMMVATAAQAEAYIFGDSRAENHYDPQIFSRATGLSFYNCGISGRGFINIYFTVSYLLQHCHPKLFIIDINLHQLDYDPDRNRYELRSFAPFQDDMPNYAKLYKAEEAAHRAYAYRMVDRLCESYRFNEHTGTILAGLAGIKPQHPNGFFTQNRVYHPDPTARRGKYFYWRDDFTILYLINTIKVANQHGVKVILCIGPHYRDDTGFKPSNLEWYFIRCVREIAIKMKLPLIELFEWRYPALQDINHYANQDHLNREGAAIFSQLATVDLLNILAQHDATTFFESRYYPKMDPKLFPF